MSRKRGRSKRQKSRLQTQDYMSDDNVVIDFHSPPHNDPHSSTRSYKTSSIPPKLIKAKNRAQDMFLSAIKTHTVIFGLGPAGTGKSYCAAAMAAEALISGDIDRIVFVGGPTRMPVVRKYFEGLFGREAEMGVDPMECVASGAAIQAGVLSGEVGDIVLVDVTPLTLGVETLGGVATALIARNTPIPVKHTETFTTAADMQTAVTIHVYQGERPMARDNASLGEFNLEGLAPAPRGVPKVDVTFDIDANGILNVTAKDQATGKSQSINITGSARLSD